MKISKWNEKKLWNEAKLTEIFHSLSAILLLLFILRSLNSVLSFLFERGMVFQLKTHLKLFFVLYNFEGVKRKEIERYANAKGKIISTNIVFRAFWSCFHLNPFSNQTARVLTSHILTIVQAFLQTIAKGFINTNLKAINIDASARSFFN